MPLTNTQENVLRRLDLLPELEPSEVDRAICPGLHFCPDWDFLPICKDSPEWDEGCNCDLPEKDG